MSKRKSILEALRNGVIPRNGASALIMTNDRLQHTLSRRSAHDAASLTAPNNSIPEEFLNLFNWDIVEVITAPLTAQRILNPVKKGNWTTKTETFVMSELAGWVEEYGDFSHAGMVDKNYNFLSRESWLFQTNLKVGDLESAEWSEASIDVFADREISAAETIRRAHDKAWLFGVNGLRNYGIMNDPGLPAAVAPLPNAASQTQWPDKSALDIFNDVRYLKKQLNLQSEGHIPDNAELILVIPNARADELLKTNEYGLTVGDRLRTAFPNLTIVETPEYSTPAGEMIQLIAPVINGRRVGELGFTEMIRSHGMIKQLSSMEEKKSAGNFGAVIYYPFAFATMLGI